MKYASRIALIALLLALCISGPIARAAPQEVEPGVTVEVVLEPVSGQGERIIQVTTDVTNTNRDETSDDNLGCSYRRAGHSADIAAVYRDTSSGARPGVTMPFNAPSPKYEVVAGSIFLNGHLVEPPITPAGFELNFDIPAADGAGAGLVHIIHQVHRLPNP